MNFQLGPKHAALLGGFILALGMQFQSAQHGWADVQSPTFIGGVLIQLGTLVAAAYMQPPAPKP